MKKKRKVRLLVQVKGTS